VMISAQKFMVFIYWGNTMKGDNLNGLPKRLFFELRIA
jgi:hypothetical protein